MEQRRIKYICYYDIESSPSQRNYVLSATNKLDYIFNCCNKLGIGVDIISASEVTEPNLGYHSGARISVGDNTLKLFASIGGCKYRIVRALNRLIVLIQLFVYLLCNTKRGEECIVYHSLGYMNLLRCIKWLKSLKYIGEIEEIYQDVNHNLSRRLKQSEYEFINVCDKYIFPTELLNKKLNPSHKPHIIIYGTYSVGPLLANKQQNGKIHIVYAGTFDHRKGGAAAAAAAAAFLPTNYHLHICGFGNAEETEMIKNVIAANQSDKYATLTFDGLKKGEEYIKFIQSCHIGLSTQNPNASFNATSFPSKILSYMSNGLSVVSIDIAAIRESKIGMNIHYYTKQEPQEIADAILSCDIDKDDNRQVITLLDAEYLESFKHFLYENN